MVISLKTTIRSIVSDSKVLSVMNSVSNGLFNNPAIVQADSMPLERIAQFIPNGGLALMQNIIEKGNAILEKMDIENPEDAIQREIDQSTGLEFKEEKNIQERNCIEPGKVWTDTEGNRIQAHGGTMFIEGDTYYWIGENKDHTMGTGTIWTWGIKIYSSKDLYNWKDEGYLVAPELKDKTSILYPTRRLDRPHLVYNKKTGKYVLWIKFIDTAHFSVLVSDSLMGEYKLVKPNLHPFGANCGDFDLAIDPETLQGYVYFEANHKDVWVAKLNSDYTDVTEERETIYKDVPVPFTREGIAHVYRNGKHYIFSSGMTGYIPNPSEVAVSDDWMTGFKVLGNPHVNDTSSASFNSQISNIFKVIGQDKYVAMADRWVPDCPITKEKYERIVKVITARNSSIRLTKEDEAFFSNLPMIGTAKTCFANYVWLPVCFDGDKPFIEWKEQWSL